MTIKNFIPFTGIFTYPIGVLLFRMILMAFESAFVLPRPAQLFVVYGIPIIFPVIITLTNIERKGRGQTDFSFSEVYGLSNKDEKHSKAYHDAAYPDVPEKFASKIPTGLVIGKHKGKYVYVPVVKDGINCMVVGTPGSGKSVMLLGFIYSMMFSDEISKKGKAIANRKYNYFMVDIKGELYEKILGIKSKDYDAEKYTDLQVVQPSNRNSYGWDVFYRIRKDDVTETEIIKTVSDIADALIMESNGDNAYFTENAKKILSGVLYYYIKHGFEFLEIMQILLRTPLDRLLSEIVDDAREKMMGIVLDKLAGFVGKEGNNSIGDIETTLKVYLDPIASYPDLAYCLQDNPYKTSPAALDDGKTNLDIAIEESMLGVYQPLFRLISMQILRHCESNFHEDDDRYTILFLDEAARIGKINGLDSAFATLRSKHTAIALFFQSISQFKDIYPEQKANTLLNLCEAKIFLSGSGDRDTTEYVKAMAGDYDAVKMSYKHKGFFGGKSDGTYSPEKRPIVDAKTMMELRDKDEAIAFIYGKYVRCKKIKYFQDPYIAPILERRKDEIKNKHIERR